MNKYFEYYTKHFGNIILDEINDKEFERIILKYDGNDIWIFFDKDVIGNKLLLIKCFNILDRYFQIDKIVKNKIAENYISNEKIRDYFQLHFQILDSESIIELFGVKFFEDFNIYNSINKLGFPGISFKYSHDNTIKILWSYIIKNKYFQKQFPIHLTEEIEILKFGN